ncbi:alpha/beta fold hydrolase [Robiginitalea marina]|uniref:Alpha/beta fold hydrolase n=1 Tax=Robiginitalea marina TaxID=2954105 RepID=A0ABT1AYI9_9FLAO|nr:alpha/beta fold hydrolase [Robiginitalea marina]MCO5724680.1 alpha/beta fold hydrolase [Robiginitalea marina]
MELLHANVLGKGTPLIILHGFLGMSDNWKTLGQKYAAAGYEVHLLDQRNHGRSFWSETFTYEVMAEDLRAYMEASGIGSAVLLGHSMGGKTAMQFACTYPERVDKLIVADIAPRRYPPHHEHILEALEALALDTLESRSAADEELAKHIEHWGIRQFLLKNLYWEQPGKLGLRVNLPVLKNRMEEIGAVLPEGARYEGPVLFLRGGASGYITDADLPLIHDHFPGARLETIEGAGHWLHAEKPDAFLGATLGFMDS